jgi:Ger(x)C family germination protein
MGSGLLALLCCSAMLGLSGCWDAKDVDNSLIVGAVGLQHKSKEALRVWLRFPLPTAAEGNAKSDFFVMNEEGSTVPDALYKIQYKIPKALDASSTRALLLDEKLANTGLSPYLEFAIRERSIPLDVVVAIVRGDMGRIFESPNPTGELSGIYTKLFFEPYAGGMARKNKTMLWEIYSKFYNPFHANLIPLLKEGKQNSFEFAGNIMFLKDKIVGELNLDESLVYELFTHKLHDSEVELLDRADFRIVHNHTRIRSAFKNGKPFIQIDCNLATTLIDSSHTKQRDTSQILAELEAHLNADAKSLIAKTQNARADVFGFGNKFRGSLQPSQYQQWPDMYQTATIEYRFHIKLRNTGLEFLD